jgi:hypothetical protein
MKQKNFKVGDVVALKPYVVKGLVGRIVRLEMNTNPSESLFTDPSHIATIESSRRQAKPFRIYEGTRRSRWVITVAVLDLLERKA